LVSRAESDLTASGFLFNLSSVVRLAELELEIRAELEEMGSDILNPC
jgi:hypothetical protein